MNSIDLSGMRAVITGGSGGIGQAVARRFLASGASVALWDARGAADTAAALGCTLGLDLDVADEPASIDAVTRTQAALGGIDILVTAAGMTGPVGSVAHYPVDDWRRLMDVHLTGTFISCKAVLAGMLARDYGRIVTVSSIAGKEGNVDGAGYSAAKAGIIGFTKALGKEVAATGVRANCFVPGLIDTPLMAQLPDWQIDRSLQKIPMGRFGTADEAAAMIAWMSSAECSFNSGATFDMSGGRATY